MKQIGILVARTTGTGHFPLCRNDHRADSGKQPRSRRHGHDLEILDIGANVQDFDNFAGLTTLARFKNCPVVASPILLDGDDLLANQPFLQRRRFWNVRWPSGCELVGIPVHSNGLLSGGAKLFVAGRFSWFGVRRTQRLNRWCDGIWFVPIDDGGERESTNQNQQADDFPRPRFWLHHRWLRANGSWFGLPLTGGYFLIGGYFIRRRWNDFAGKLSYSGT